MASINKPLELLWKVEYSNNPALMLHKVKNDAGGMTYCGIARKYHADWVGWKHVDNAIKLSNSLKEASVSLSKDFAVASLVRDFYNVEFWQSIKGNLIKKPSIATEMFLSCVNIGIKPCITLAQRTVGVADDGLFGIKTLSAINAFDSKLFCKKYTILEVERYKELVRRNANNAGFLEGWIARAYAVSDNNAELLDRLQ